MASGFFDIFKMFVKNTIYRVKSSCFVFYYALKQFVYFGGLAIHEIFSIFQNFIVFFLTQGYVLTLNLYRILGNLEIRTE